MNALQTILKLTNDTSDTCKCVSMHNYFNASGVINNADEWSLVRFTWEATLHREKGIQDLKEKFAN